MSAAEERIRALTDYCLAHRCEGCPMNTPELACIDVEDTCILDVALTKLLREES